MGEGAKVNGEKSGIAKTPLLLIRFIAEIKGNKHVFTSDNE